MTENFAKLRWQCRRGTQELDRLLIRYLELSYPTAEFIEQQTFAQLLMFSDKQLLQFFLSPTPMIPHEFTQLVCKIQQLSTVYDS